MANLAFNKVRLHIPIQTNPGVYFYVDDERIHMKLGGLYYVNFSKVHWVKNGGKEVRLHLVLDLEVKGKRVTDYRYKLLPVFSNLLPADPEVRGLDPLALDGRFEGGAFGGTFAGTVTVAAGDDWSAQFLARQGPNEIWFVVPDLGRGLKKLDLSVGGCGLAQQFGSRTDEPQCHDELGSMPHDVSLIATIAAGFGLAMVFGLLAVQLRIGPYGKALLTFATAASDQQTITTLAAPRADAQVALRPYLSKLILPRGVADLVSDRPPADIQLMAAKASLLVRADLHPAIQYLLLDAAAEIHGQRQAPRPPQGGQFGRRDAAEVDRARR